MRALVLVAIGCGGTPASTPVAVKPTAPPPTASPCERAPKLPADFEAAPRWCVSLHHRDTTHWYFMASDYEALSDATGKVLYSVKYEEPVLDEGTRDQQAADLDGDGRDELLYVTCGTDSHIGIRICELYIQGFDDLASPQATKLMVEGDPEGPNCKATWKLIDREGGGKNLEVTGNCQSDTYGGEPQGPTVVYGWKANSLVREP